MREMASVRDYLQLFRSHTSPLEMLIAASGAALASGSVLSNEVLLFSIFGWFYHNAGYGHNSVEDFIAGYDRDDPHKCHHPLQRGAIHPRTARAVTLAMIIVSFTFGSFICGVDPLSISLLACLTLMGFVYNIYGKRMGAKFLPIAAAHSLLFPFAYFGSGGQVALSASFPFVDPPGVLLLTGYLVLQITYQIMIEGDLKDMDMSEASYLRELGVRVEGGRFKASFRARATSFALKGSSIAVLFVALSVLGGAWYEYIQITIFGFVLVVLDHRLMRERIWEHGDCLRTMALMEVCSTFALVAVISPSIGGPVPASGMMVLGIVYFVLMNRFLWGTMLVPKV